MPKPVGSYCIRRYRPDDRAAVMDLFIRVNRSLAPPGLEQAFEAYVAMAIDGEIGQIDQYYNAARNRSFWVATDGSRLLGNFGLEPVDAGSIEVRRMYVDFPFRRHGLARAMLRHAESRARFGGFARVVLSTSNVQLPALALYRSAGFELIREEIASSASLKTVGNGILRYYLEKSLLSDTMA